MTGGLACNACNKGFQDEIELKRHYKSDWHRYNLKRKAAGVPGVTEALFLARQSALVEETKKSNETPMLYRCGLCGKSYRSTKAHAQHLQSKSHLKRAAQGMNSDDEETTIIRPLPRRIMKKPSRHDEQDDEESEWEEVDPDEDLVAEATDSLTELKTHEGASDSNMIDEGEDDEYDEDVDPSCCFMCDLEHDSIESCTVHMFKQHGFFIPDVEYLKDPKGLLTYLGLKVKRDFMCLYCNYKCHPFSSLEGVRKHMAAKSHCKVHYGDGGDDDEGELEDFYDYSSSYMDADGKQLIVGGDMHGTVELGSGSELIITKMTDNGMSTRILGHREFLRYYRQKPRPFAANSIACGKAISAALASRYRSMGLATVQSKQNLVTLKVLKVMNRSGVESMRSKIGMKSNVIRNLPKNVPY